MQPKCCHPLAMCVLDRSAHVHEITDEYSFVHRMSDNDTIFLEDPRFHLSPDSLRTCEGIV